MRRRAAVVTGAGAVSPLGATVDDLWDGLVAGRSGLGFLTACWARRFPVRVVGAALAVPPPEAAGARASQLLHLAAREAAAQARLDEVGARSRCGLFLGRMIDFPPPEELVAAYRAGACPPPASDRLLRDRLALAPALLARELGIGGRLRTATLMEGACATGAMAIGEAFRGIRAGELDLALAAAATSWIDPIGLSVYHRLDVLSKETEEPRRASRPFDARRSGFVMAEGAAAVVLESAAHARRRGAEALAAVTGYGVTCSAHRLTDMPADGAPQSLAMALALRDAGRRARDVDYVNAHGTATEQNDASETRALRALFGRLADQVPVSSNKSMLGHTVTAAGGLETIATIRAIRAGVVPPTINLDHPDPDCDLDYVANRARSHRVGVALNNSFGFGGHNGVLVLEAA